MQRLLPSGKLAISFMVILLWEYTKPIFFLILIIAPLFSKANALRKIRNFIDSTTAMRTYKAYILCHFKRVFFCRVIQYPIEWNELIYYMLWTPFRFSKLIEYNLLSQLSPDTVRQWQLIQSLVHISKGFHKEGPTNINNFISY